MSYPENRTDLRGSNVGNRTEIIDSIVKEMSGAIFDMLDYATRTCLNCENFRPEDGEKCGLNNQVPPPIIAARGCECYEDKVPF